MASNQKVILNFSEKKRKKEKELGRTKLNDVNFAETINNIFQFCHLAVKISIKCKLLQTFVLLAKNLFIIFNLKKNLWNCPQFF